MSNPRRSLAALRRTAVHEAGHAVVAEVLGLGCTEISIIPDYEEGTAGYATYSVDPLEASALWDRRGIWHRDGRSAAVASAITLLSGAAAERVVLGRAGAGASDDRRRSAWFVDDLTPADGDVRKTMRQLERAAAGLVRRHSPAIQSLADALMERRELRTTELAEILERALSASPTIARYGAVARETTHQVAG